MTPDQVFAKAFNGNPNFMTPAIHYRAFVGPYAVELSEGSSIMGSGSIYGVTVLNQDGSRPANSGLSQCFHSYTDAQEYIVSLASDE